VAGPIGRVGWKVIGLALGLPIGIAARKAIEAGWRNVRGTEPPKKAGAVDAHWGEAIAWAGASAAAMAAARVVATRAAAETYRTITGRQPPGLDKSR